MVRERGSGITPPRVVELLKKEVSEKSILAVSRVTGLGLAAIGRYLKGIGEPTTASLQKLADYFGVSVAWLRGEDGALEHFRSQEPDARQEHDLFSAALHQNMMETIFDIESSKNRFPQIWEAFLSVPDESKPEALDVMKKYCELSITGLKVFIERNMPSNEAKTEKIKPEEP